MKYYFAPMEGITGYIFRNAHARHFNHFDRYYAPFIVADKTNTFKSKDLNDILPENNKGIHLIPQILTNKAEDFIHTANKIAAYGYQEINLNLGCPSGTVVSKKRGSGLLAFPEELDRFLDELYENTDLDISIKTRIGIEDVNEFGQIMAIYNQYPVKELIVHPRLQKQMYKGTPHMEAFELAVKEAKMPVCYNGNLFSKEDFNQFTKVFSEISSVMLGRGILMNPALLNKIQGGQALDAKTLKAFHDDLCAAYEQILFGDRNVLFKMKEIWFYLKESFDGGEKQLKRIKKAEKLDVYRDAVRLLFEEVNLKNL